MVLKLKIPQHKSAKKKELKPLSREENYRILTEEALSGVEIRKSVISERWQKFIFFALTKIGKLLASSGEQEDKKP